MKRLVLAMSLLVVVSIGSAVQAQGLGTIIRPQDPQNPAQTQDVELQQARLQQVADLEQQLQDGRIPENLQQDSGQGQAARIPGQPPAVPGTPGQGLPGQGLPGQGLPGQGPAPQAGQIQPTQDAAQIQAAVGPAPVAEIQDGGPGVIEGGVGVIEGGAGPDGLIVEEQINVQPIVAVPTQKLSIGVLVEPLPGLGLKVVDVIHGSKAEFIGLAPGMLMKKVNRIPVYSAEQFEALLHQAIELRHGRVEILVRNLGYDGYNIPEFAVLEMEMLQLYRPAVVETYNDYHYDNYHYDYGHVEYSRPYRPYGGGGCHR